MNVLCGHSSPPPGADAIASARTAFEDGGSRVNSVAASVPLALVLLVEQGESPCGEPMLLSKVVKRDWLSRAS